MDYIRQFDIKLEREVYYSGETVNGYVIMDTVQNVKVRGIRAVLRGKCAAEWKIMKSGQRSGVNERQYFIDDKVTLWGNDKKDELSIPILEAGYHQFPFKFPLPDTTLPCSFESRAGKIRYYVKVTIDIPYASPPQGIKHFTVIGPTTDCGDEKFTVPIVAQDMKVTCCFCWRRGPISLRCTLNRSAYCSGEPIELRSEIDNQGNEAAALRVRLVQHVEYFIDSRAIGVTKYLTNNIIDYRSEEVPISEKRSFDDNSRLIIPVTPPTLIGIAKNIQIYYVLKVCLESASKTEDLHLDFPLTIATVPLSHILDENQRVILAPASDNVEGGMYTSPEFQIGQVYDGTSSVPDDVVLYRPVYVKVLPAMTEAGSGEKTEPTQTRDEKQHRNGSAHNHTLHSAETAKLFDNQPAIDEDHLAPSNETAIRNNLNSAETSVPPTTRSIIGEKSLNLLQDSGKTSPVDLQHQKHNMQLHMRSTPPPKSRKQIVSQNSRDQLLPLQEKQATAPSNDSSSQQPRLRRRTSSDQQKSTFEGRGTQSGVRNIPTTSGHTDPLQLDTSFRQLESTAAQGSFKELMAGNHAMLDSSAIVEVGNQKPYHYTRQESQKDDNGAGQHPDINEPQQQRARNAVAEFDRQQDGAFSTASGRTSTSAQRENLEASLKRSSAISATAYKLQKQTSQDSGSGSKPKHVSRL